jgi:hypothetical protein
VQAAQKRHLLTMQTPRRATPGTEARPHFSSCSHRINRAQTEHHSSGEDEDVTMSQTFTSRPGMSHGQPSEGNGPSQSGCGDLLLPLHPMEKHEEVTIKIYPLHRSGPPATDSACHPIKIAQNSLPQIPSSKASHVLARTLTFAPDPPNTISPQAKLFIESLTSIGSHSYLLLSVPNKPADSVYPNIN